METNFNAFFIDLDGTTIDIPEEQNTENLGIRTKFICLTTNFKEKTNNYFNRESK